VSKTEEERERERESAREREKEGERETGRQRYRTGQRERERKRGESQRAKEQAKDRKTERVSAISKEVIQAISIKEEGNPGERMRESRTQLVTSPLGALSKAHHMPRWHLQVHLTFFNLRVFIRE